MLKNKLKSYNTHNKDSTTGVRNRKIKKRAQITKQLGFLWQKSMVKTQEKGKKEEEKTEESRNGIKKHK